MSSEMARSNGNLHLTDRFVPRRQSRCWPSNLAHFALTL